MKFKSLRSASLWVFIVVLTVSSGLNAQKKRELIASIDSLKLVVRELQTDLSRAEQREKASQAQAELYEKQASDLKSANATLLKNLNNFAEVSSKNTSALSQTLSSLEAKEGQLRTIVETFSRNDSVIIALLSQAKQTLGATAKLKISSGGLLISGGLNEVFTEEEGLAISDSGSKWLEGIAKLAGMYPELNLTVEGLSMTGEISLAARQAAAVMNTLRDSLKIGESRLSSRGRDGNFSEGIDVIMHPNYRRFYLETRKEIQN